VNIGESVASRAGAAARSARERIARKGKRAPAADEPVGGPPRDAVVVSYATVLDGATLWLATDPPDAAIGLRSRADGRSLSPDQEAEISPIGHRGTRVDLTDLTGEAPAAYDVVAVRREEAARPVWMPETPTGPSIGTPTDDERVWFDVKRAANGRLELTSHRVATTARLDSIALVPEGVEIAVAGVRDRDELQLRNADGPARARFPLVVRDGVGRGTLTVAGLPTEGQPFAQVVVGRGRGSRSNNGLRRPNDAVMLPELYGEAAELVARIRWSDGGLLSIRLLHLEPDADVVDDEPGDEPDEDGAA
jgi:hypothetical protein